MLRAQAREAMHTCAQLITSPEASFAAIHSKVLHVCVKTPP